MRSGCGKFCFIKNHFLTTAPPYKMEVAASEGYDLSVTRDI